MKAAYPELQETATRVDRVLDEEEARFARTVTVGLQRLDEELRNLKSCFEG